MNWAPPHIILNDPVKKPTNKTEEPYIQNKKKENFIQKLIKKPRRYDSIFS